MPTVENFTPTVLWTTLYGMLAMCLIFMIGYKVYDAINTIIDRRKKRKESEKPDFAEEVSQKVIEKLEPRFQKIEENLKEDKNRLDKHEDYISSVKEGLNNTREGLVAICEYLIIETQFGKDSKQLQDATAKMTQYIASQIGGSKK